jgi:hypothetical protein
MWINSKVSLWFVSDRAIYSKSLPVKSLNDIALLEIGETCPKSHGNDLKENKFVVSGCMQIPQQLDFPQGGNPKVFRNPLLLVFCKLDTEYVTLYESIL